MGARVVAAIAFWTGAIVLVANLVRLALPPLAMNSDLGLTLQQFGIAILRGATLAESIALAAFLLVVSHRSDRLFESAVGIAALVSIGVVGIIVGLWLVQPPEISAEPWVSAQTLTMARIVLQLVFGLSFGLLLLNCWKGPQAVVSALAIFAMSALTALLAIVQTYLFDDLISSMGIFDLTRLISSLGNAAAVCGVIFGFSFFFLRARGS
jgi:hypothetical protein